MTVPNLGADPVVNGARRVAFMSADDGTAKKQVENLLKGLGYAVIDLGNLRDGGLTPASRWSSRRSRSLGARRVLAMRSDSSDRNTCSLAKQGESTMTESAAPVRVIEEIAWLLESRV